MWMGPVGLREVAAHQQQLGASQYPESHLRVFLSFSAELGMRCPGAGVEIPNMP